MGMDKMGYLTPKEVGELLGVDVSTIHRWRKKTSQEFPDSIHISERIVVFRKTDILEWIEGRVKKEVQKNGIAE